MKQVDVLIVGQGMAGTALAVQLGIRNVSYTMIDKNHESSSSIMSAGMYNPIVFKRVTKSWQVDKVLPVLLQFCDNVKVLLGKSYQNTTDVYRLFANQIDQNNWYERMDSPLFEDYLSDGDAKQLPSHIKANFGYGVVKQAGEVKLKLLLTDFQEWLLQNDTLKLEEFDYNQLTNNDGRWNYKSEVSAKYVVFCEGFQALNNPYFKWAPIKPNKGQLLVVKCKDLKFKSVLNSGFFVQPLGDDLYTIGSTYELDKTDLTLIEEKKQELIDKLRSITQLDFEIISHTAGIRPTVLDRKPLLGEHPEKKGLYIFNGFGTKAVMLAPFHANEFLDYLLEGQELDKEINITRYYKYHQTWD
jgi:glycine oxidase